MERWYQVAVLSAGGVLGVNARYWLGILINRWTGVQFPWATFTINVSGSFAIGFLSVLLARWLPHHMSRPHTHPHDRHIVVLSGTWWVGTGKDFSPDTTTPLPAGTVVTHIAKQVHYDGANDEPVTLEIVGEGPQ